MSKKNKISDIEIRKDNAIIVETAKHVTVLHPDGESVTVNKRTGKLK